MNSKQASVTLVAISVFPLHAYAQPEQTSSGASALVGLLWTVLPIIVVGIMFWVVLSRVVRKQQTRSENYIADQKQHNERIEQLLERIARAVERKETDVR